MRDGDARLLAAYEHIGRRVATFRKDAGLSQSDLALAVGLTRSSISNIEKGRQKMLIHTLLEIADVLRIPPYSLLPKSLGPSDAQKPPFSGSEISESERVQLSALVERLISSKQESSS